MQKKCAKSNLVIVEMIAKQFMDQQKKDNFLFSLQEAQLQHKKLLQLDTENLKQEREFYIERIQKYLEEDETKLDSYNMGALDECTSHPLRQAESRYLQQKYHLSAGKNELENWAIIGMHLSSLEVDTPINVAKWLSGKTSSKRGRPKTSHSIDYTRAVWVLFVNAYKMEKQAIEILDGNNSSLDKYSSNQIIEAYQYAFEHPDAHPFLWVFERLEGLLKMKNRSLNSLLTSFHRGERERIASWKKLGLASSMNLNA